MADEVALKMTRRQAETLWWLLEGEMLRYSFEPSTMRRLDQIGKRLSDQMGYRWQSQKPGGGSQ